MLEQDFSFADELDEEIDSMDTNTDSSQSTTYTNYITISDETNQIKIEVPAEWNDINSGAWIVNDENIGVRLFASSDLNAYNNGWTEPGVFFAASRSLAEQFSAEEFVDIFDFSDECQYQERKPYEDALYTGVYDVWTDCGNENTLLVVLSAVPEDSSFVALLWVKIVSEADVDALDRIFDSFVVLEELQ